MEFVFRGGHLALDFLNTEVMEAPGRPADLLVDVAALRQWFVDTGLSTQPGADVSPALLAQARLFRGALRSIVAARIEGKPYSPAALTDINMLLQAGTGYTALEVTGGELRRSWRRTNETPLMTLLPLAISAVELLTGDQADYIRQCGNPECILYFLDTSKNHTRRWCSMDSCGNRMKAAAHYRRKTGRVEDMKNLGA